MFDGPWCRGCTPAGERLQGMEGMGGANLAGIAPAFPPLGRAGPTPRTMNRPSPPRLPGLDERRRQIQESKGRNWEVREVPNGDYDRRGGTSLIFESTDIIRRVRNFP